MKISRRHLIRLVFSSILITSAAPSLGKRRQRFVFTPDPQIQKEAEGSSSEAQALAKTMGKSLDGSEASVQVLESLLDSLYKNGQTAKVSEATLQHYGKLFGYYWGEVYRLHHQGTWGTLAVDGKNIPALRYSEDPANDALRPCDMAENRLLYGKDWDVAKRYAEMVKSE